MYLDGKRIAMGLFAIGASYLLFVLINNRNESLEEEIEFLETGTSSNPEIIEKERASYEGTLAQAKVLLAEEKFHEASRLLYHSYPKFENYLNMQGYKEISPGLTLRDWHAKESESLIPVLDKAYERMKLLTSSGDISPIALRDFINHTPFPYINKIKQRYRTDRRTIQEARVKNSPSWFVVRVIGVMGSSAPYEERVRDELRTKWSNNAKLKLVFGGTMSNAEKQAAARSLYIQIDGESTSYQSVKDDGKRGSDEFLYSLAAKFSLQKKGDTPASTSWDQIAELSVIQEPPESLTATFDRFDKNQQADFSKVLDEQYEKLMTKFEDKLQEIPEYGER